MADGCGRSHFFSTLVQRQTWGLSSKIGQRRGFGNSRFSSIGCKEYHDALDNIVCQSAAVRRSVGIHFGRVMCSFVEKIQESAYRSKTRISRDPCRQSGWDPHSRLAAILASNMSKYSGYVYFDPMTIKSFLINFLLLVPLSRRYSELREMCSVATNLYPKGLAEVCDLRIPPFSHDLVFMLELFVWG